MLLCLMLVSAGCTSTETGCGFSLVGCGDGESAPYPLYYDLVPSTVLASLHVGERRQFEGRFYLQYATTGYMIWSSEDVRVLRWVPAQPACPNDRCAVLEALAPGTTRVSIKHCLPEATRTGCAERRIQVTVSP